MRAQPRFLNALIYYWHPDAEAFMLEGQSLTPMIEDIYLLMVSRGEGIQSTCVLFPPGLTTLRSLLDSIVRLVLKK
jgi:hypothetical protein